eukprot:3103231-Rhodomonas_salina.2
MPCLRPDTLCQYRTSRRYRSGYAMPVPNTSHSAIRLIRYASTAHRTAPDAMPVLHTAQHHHPFSVLPTRYLSTASSHWAYLGGPKSGRTLGVGGHGVWREGGGRRDS